MLRKNWNEACRQLPVSTVFEVCLALALYDADSRRPLRGEDATDLASGVWTSLDRLVRGFSSEDDWSNVVCSLNIGMILAERGIAPEYEQTFIDALEGAFRAKLRAERTGKWRLDGPALLLIREALEVHYAQIDYATKDDMRATLQEVHRRVKEDNVYKAAA